MKDISQNRQFSVRLLRGCLCSVLLFAPWTYPSVARTVNQPEAQSRNANNWRDLFTSIFRRKPPVPSSQGGSRGRFCFPLALGTTFDQGTAELWNQRPNFIWTGRIRKIIVKETDASEPLWQKTIPFDFATDNALSLKALRYSGPVLESGKQYQWQAFISVSDSSPQAYRTFSILPLHQRGPITRAWLQEQVLLTQANATEREQALQQSEFWFTNGLSADLYQSLFIAAMRGHLDGEGEAIVDGIIKEQCRN